MTLHLAGAATEAAALMGAQPEDETLRKVLRLIQLLPLRLESIVEPDGRGTLTLNLPPLVLATVDSRGRHKRLQVSQKKLREGLLAHQPVAP